MVAKEMKIAEVLARYPETMNFFMEFGLGCVGCYGASFETIEEGCLKHGMTEEDIDELVNGINEIIVQGEENNPE